MTSRSGRELSTKVRYDLSARTRSYKFIRCLDLNMKRGISVLEDSFPVNVVLWQGQQQLYLLMDFSRGGLGGVKVKELICTVPNANRFASLE